MNIAIMLPNWVGDVVMATSALQLLRHDFPRARLIGIMRPPILDLLRGTDWLDEAIGFSRKGDEQTGDAGRLLRHLRRQPIDKFLLLTNSFSTAWIAWRAGARQRIGFARHGRGWLLTHRLKAPRRRGRFLPRSAVDHYLEVAQAAGCGDARPPVRLVTVAEEEAAADRVWETFGWNREDRVVTLNTGAAYGPAKSWPNEHFAALARRMANELDTRVLVICGPRERPAAAEIERQAAHCHVRSLAEMPVGIGLSKACVRRSRLMVSTDSGPRHFAAAFQVPLITLFGPTDPRWSDNYHRHAVNLERNLPCRPCAKRTCPLGHHGCMRELTPEDVFQSVRRQLADPIAA